MAKSFPRYIADPLYGFLEYLHETTRLLHMSMRVISRHMALPNTIKVLRDTDNTQYSVEEAARRKEEYVEELKAAKDSAEFAEKEIKNGFPLLNAHALVGLWGAIDSAVEDALVGTLMHEPDLLRSEAFARLRIPLAEFETLERDERMRLLVQELRRGQPPDQAQGVEALERLLSHIGLSGDVSPKTKKAMWEMQNVRNVIVHRGSIADRRLIKHCPWLGLKVGDEVKVPHTAIHKYDAALHDYLYTIIKRLAVKYDVAIDESGKNLPDFPEEEADPAS